MCWTSKTSTQQPDKTPMKIYLGILLLAAIAISGSTRADAEPLFLKVGNWYTISASTGEPIPISSVGALDFNSGRVKILKVAANQWCWVEYDSVSLPPDVNNRDDFKGQVLIGKERIWLNFARLITVSPTAEPDYQYYKKNYAGGVKIEPSHQEP
jgi:hypothetical protein